MRRMELDRCFECGACSYVCPARLDIVACLRTGKEQLRLRREKMAKKAVPVEAEAAAPAVPETNETTQQEVTE